jgi:hypothetical protein
MRHYWTADDDPATRQAQAEDWLESLEDLPVASVEAACREWRESEHRRPTIADIRRLAVSAANRSSEREQLRALPAPKPSPKAKPLHPWEPGFAARYDEPWFQALPMATQRQFKEQDLERASLWRRVKAGELPDSAWLDYCRRQIAQNMELHRHRSTVAPSGVAPSGSGVRGDDDRVAFAGLLRSWGVDAVEHEQPVEPESVEPESVEPESVEPDWLRGIA